MIIHKLMSRICGDPVTQTYDENDRDEPFVIAAIRLHYGYYDAEGFASVAIAVHKSGTIFTWTKGIWVGEPWQFHDSETVKKHAEIEQGMQRLKAVTRLCGRHVCESS